MGIQLNKITLKKLLLFLTIFSLFFIEISTESINNPQDNNKINKNETSNIKRNTVNRRNPISNTKNPVKTVTPKKYRKNFVIRIPKTVYKSDGPKRITITRTTPPSTIEYEIPTHTSDETTTYYSTFAYDFISPSPQLSRIFRTRKKSSLTSKVSNNNNESIPITKAP